MRHIRKLFLPLFAVGFGLCLIEAILFVLARLNLEISPLLQTLYTFVSINEEGTIASWYSASLWLVVGLLASILYLYSKPRQFPWIIMAMVALYASMDESTEIHEYFYHVGDIITPLLPFDIGFTWVLPGMILALIVVGLLLRFILKLTPTVKWPIIISGIMFVGGAIGVEILSGILHVSDVHNSMLALTYILIEEMLEMTAVALVIATLGSLFRLDRPNDCIVVDNTAVLN